LPLWIVALIAVRLRAKAAISLAVSRRDLEHAVAIDQSDKVIGRIVANGALK
jgi:nitrogen fixation protein